jgi:hypothetical protein
VGVTVQLGAAATPVPLTVLEVVVEIDANEVTKSIVAFAAPMACGTKRTSNVQVPPAKIGLGHTTFETGNASGTVDETLKKVMAEPDVFVNVKL